MKLFNKCITVFVLSAFISAQAQVTHISDEQQLQEIKQKPVAVIKVGAQWCPACVRAVEPFEKLAQEFSNASFASIDVDVYKNFAQRNNVSSLPTFIIYKDGKEVARKVGFSENFKKEISSVLQDSSEKKNLEQPAGQLEAKPLLQKTAALAPDLEKETPAPADVCPEEAQSIFENWFNKVADFFSSMGAKVRSWFQ